MDWYQYRYHVAPRSADFPVRSGSYRAGYACLLDMLIRKYPDAKIYSIQNSELGEEYNESSREVCAHYGIQLIELHDIDKQNGHPSVAGMQSICDQLLEAVK